MTDAMWAALAVVASGVIGWLSNAWRTRHQARVEAKAANSADWQAFTDDLRAEIRELRSDNETLRKRATEADEKMASQSESIARLWLARQEDQAALSTAIGHIAVLEGGVQDGTIPPLPERPILLRPIVSSPEP